MSTVAESLERGPFPCRDGWGWLYRAFDRIAPAGSAVRRAVCRYFQPNAIERARRGAIFRILGVHLFGAIIPTGGVAVRRITKARMAPYTLAGPSIGAARAFYYRTCVFEALHLPFLLAMVALALHRLAIGRADLAIENTVVNVALNVYPILHHRRTRTRILLLLERRSVSSEPETHDG